MTLGKKITQMEKRTPKGIKERVMHQSNIRNIPGPRER
jgi:hypothetical protein